MDTSVMQDNIKSLYEKILRVPANECPPNYYQLLRISLFESDGSLIHEAALGQIHELKQWEIHPDAETRDAVHDMINKVSAACTILEVEHRKADYDQHLANQLGIELSTNEYQTLTTEVELHLCPNCQSSVSRLTILCIECGYSFETGEVVETDIGDTIWQDAGGPINEDTSGLISTFLRLFSSVLWIVVVVAVVGGVLYFFGKSYITSERAVLKDMHMFSFGFLLVLFFMAYKIIKRLKDDFRL